MPASSQTTTLALILAIAAAVGAALVTDDAPPPPKDEPEPPAAKAPAPPAPAAAASAPALPKPTSIEACIARRAARDIQPDDQIDKIADVFVEDVAPKAALTMVRALVTEAARMPTPDQRGRAMAHLGAALAELGQDEEAKAVLAQAVSAASSTSAPGPGQSEALLLCAVGHARLKDVNKAKELAKDGRALAEVAAALADVGAAEEAKQLLEQAAVGVDKAHRLHRFAYLKALAAVGETKKAEELADAFEQAGDQALAHAQLAGALDAKRHAAPKKRAIQRAQELLGEAEVKWERRAALLLELSESSDEAKDAAGAKKLRAEALDLARAHKTEMVGGAIMAQVAGSMAEAGQLEDAKKVLTELEGSPLVGVVALPMTRAQVQNLAGEHTAALDTISKGMTTWSAYAYARVLAAISGQPPEKVPADVSKAVQERACTGL